MDESDDNSRREFLRVLGLSSGAALVGTTGCRGSTGGSVGDNQSNASVDTGQGPGSDAGTSSCEPTGSDVLGPFHEEGAPERTVLAGEDEPGERLIVEGTVYEPDCETPISGAHLDVWQADVEGDYHGGEEDDYRLRGQMTTDEDGTYRFETIVPGNYPMPDGQIRPAHIHFTVTQPGFSPLTTQMYFESDPHLAPDDPCTGCNSGDPTLIVELEDGGGEAARRASFDIVLQAS